MKKHVIGHISSTYGMRGGIFGICGQPLTPKGFEELLFILNRGILDSDCKICIRVYNESRIGKKCCTDPVCYKFGVKRVKK